DVSGKNFATFKAQTGVLDHGRMRFQVLVDGRVKYCTQTLRPGHVEQVSAEVTGAKTVLLRVLNDGGNTDSSDSGAWGDARFIQGGAPDPLEDPPSELASASEANAALLVAEIHHRLCQRELARRWFAKAVAWIDKNPAKSKELCQLRDEVG